jgi:hypothetical protein
MLKVFTKSSIVVAVVDVGSEAADVTFADSDAHQFIPFGIVKVGDYYSGTGYLPLIQIAQPTIDPITQKIAPAPSALVSGVWTQQWSISALTPAEIAVNQAAAAQAMQAAILAGMASLFDTVAQKKHYDNRITCALRAGYTGPFQTEGAAFATWMDACNQTGYTLLAEVQAGTRPMPATVADALALLPIAPW